MSKLKYLAKTAISMYLACNIFLSGCSTYTSPKRISSVPASRIQFLEEDRKTVDDLVRVTGDLKDSIDYVARFSIIKKDIRIDNEETTKRDIKNLVYDIESSNIGNRYRLAEQIKDFGYYRFDEVNVVPPPINSPEFWNDHPVLSVLALGGILMVGKGIGDEEKKEGGGESLLGAALFAGSIILIKTKVKRETYYNKVYYNPYKNESRTIDTHLENPR